MKKDILKIHEEIKKIQKVRDSLKEELRQIEREKKMGFYDRQSIIDRTADGNSMAWMEDEMENEVYCNFCFKKAPENECIFLLNEDQQVEECLCPKCADKMEKDYNDSRQNKSISNGK